MMNMKKINFKKLDAFTDGASAGNPAGLVYLEQDVTLTSAEMLRLTYELKGWVSEVAFATPGTDAAADLDFRYFSCEREVPFCGHATVAAAYELGRELPTLQSRDRFLIRTRNKGILEVENRVATENLVYIQAPKVEWLATVVNLRETAQALNLPMEAINPELPLEIVNAGQNILLVPLLNRYYNIDCRPDYQTLRDYCLAIGAEAVNIYSPDTFMPVRNYRTRVFAPTFGYLEAPATGSGNAALGYYLIKHRLWTDEKLVIEQGPDRELPNRVVLKHDAAGIRIGGNGTVRLVGVYNLM